MGFRLYESQEAIKSYLEATFPGYKFYRGGVPDAEEILYVDNRIRAYVTLRFRPMQKSGGPGSMAGVRHDDYFSTFDLNVIAADDGQAGQIVSIMTDRVIGFKSPYNNAVSPEGGTGDFVLRNAGTRPSAYVQSQRFRYTLNTVDPQEYIQQPGA